MEVLLSYRHYPRALSDARLVTIEGGVALPLPSLFDPVRVVVPVSSLSIGCFFPQPTHVADFSLSDEDIKLFWKVFNERTGAQSGSQDAPPSPSTDLTAKGSNLTGSDSETVRVADLVNTSKSSKKQGSGVEATKNPNPKVGISIPGAETKGAPDVSLKVSAHFSTSQTSEREVCPIKEVDGKKKRFNFDRSSVREESQDRWPCGS